MHRAFPINSPRTKEIGESYMHKQWQWFLLLLRCQIIPHIHTWAWEVLHTMLSSKDETIFALVNNQLDHVDMKKERNKIGHVTSMQDLQEQL